MPLPIAASCPDKRDFVINEAIEAGEQAIRTARAALAQAQTNLTEKTRALTTGVEAERQTQEKYQASLARPEDAKGNRQAAIAAVTALPGPDVRPMTPVAN